MARAGRPTAYKPEFCDTVINLGADGCSLTEMASELGVSRQTVYAWMDEHPEFLDAMTRARTESQAWWERKAREGIISANGVSINAALWSKYMAARFPDDYKEKREIEQRTFNVTIQGDDVDL